MSLEQAQRHLLHDRLDEAADLLREVSRGTGVEARRAKIEAGRLAVRRGDAERALEWFRDAWGTPASADPDDAIARAEAARYLGELLERLGEYIQAETVLRAAMDERQETDGADDTEAAALAISLAAVLLTLKRRGEAKLLSEVGARVLWEAGDERAVEGLLVRAMAIKATQGRHYDALEPVYSLPPETQDALLREAIVGQRHRAKHLVPVLFELNHWHKAQRGGLGHPQILALIAELAQRSGRNRERIQALEELCLYFLTSGEPDMHGHALVALARAHGESRQPEKGVALLVEAASVRQHPSALLREAGTLAGDPELLRQAVAAGVEEGSEEATARAHAALGVLLAHRSDAEALVHLEAGARLPSPDPDAQLARLHLVTVREEAACGCGDAAGAMSRALQDALYEGGPGDLVHLAGVIGTPSGLELRLELTREPTPSEREFVDQTVARVRRMFERAD